MKFGIKIILVIALIFVFQGLLGLPWWTVALSGLIPAAFVRGKAAGNFLAGFLGAFGSWSLRAWMIDSGNEGLLSGRIAEIFGTSPMVLVLITGVIGGLVAGLAALTGGQLLQIIRPGQERR